MFGTFLGLPLHALVIHAVVILVPLGGLLSIGLAVRPQHIPTFGWWVVGLNGAMTLTTYVAMKSGEALFATVKPNPLVIYHQSLGSIMVYFVLAMFVASALLVLARRPGGVVLVLAAILMVGAAGAAIVQVARTGHSGSRAVWGA